MIGAKADVSRVNFLRAAGPRSKPVRDAKYRSFTHAAASIRKTARQSIKPAPPETRRRARRRKGQIVSRARSGASRPGAPPHTRRGQIRRAVLFSADQRGAVIGTAGSLFGDAGAAHEHGGEFRGSRYPARPFMFPALQSNLDRFHESWRGSIGN